MRVKTTKPVTKQFNFESNWPKKIRPLLKKPAVVRALNFGMIMQGDDYRPGDPPWEHGRGPINGQRAKEGCLSWYQPWGRCHYIAPFSWAIGKELFPDLNWGILTGDFHTVAIGYADQWQQPEWVMDILLFRENSAKESLDYAQKNWFKFFPCILPYLASFCDDSEEALKTVTDSFALYGY